MSTDNSAIDYNDPSPTGGGQSGAGGGSTFGHPNGLFLLFFTEMWERFSYYGMRAILVLFATKQLLMDKSFATDQIFGSFTGLVYLTPIIGGFIADNYWGNRRSIVTGGLLMAAGNFMLFMSGASSNHLFLYIGLGLLVIGNGFFKPNISTMVGQLYPERDVRIDAAYTIFYMGINLGAFFAPLVCGYLGENVDFKWGFLAASIGMLLGVATFVMFRDKYLVSPTGEQLGVQANKKNLKAGEKASDFKLTGSQIGVFAGLAVGLFSAFHFLGGFDLIGSLIFTMAIALPTVIIMDSTLTKIERDRILVIYAACFFVIFFWSAFEQAGTSLTFFADTQTNREMFNFVMPASWFNSFNAIFVFIFAPLFSVIWLRLNRNGLEPNSLYKMAIGLLLLAIGYLWISRGVLGVDPTDRVSIMWLTVLYLLHTFGELCLSPIGLAMVNKLSPARFASLLMGVWFLANASANKFSGMLGAFMPEAGKEAKNFFGFVIQNNYDFFMLFVVMAGVASVILFILTKSLTKLAHGMLS
jgi:proton-dependent oligopeptide transporter, POT family